ncbi:MAG: hypothetical protein NC244_05325 [Alistipes senegalensis]|nr:hypothetical protein [Alistipes senegalensis]
MYLYVLIMIWLLWLAVSAIMLISAMEEFRKTDKSDIDKLKVCKKKIIFRSIMNVVPIVLSTFFV